MLFALIGDDATALVEERSNDEVAWEKSGNGEESEQQGGACRDNLGSHSPDQPGKEDSRESQKGRRESPSHDAPLRKNGAEEHEGIEQLDELLRASESERRERGVEASTVKGQDGSKHSAEQELDDLLGL